MSNIIQEIDKILYYERNLPKACELIKSAIHQGINLQGRNIVYAHVLLLSKNWPEITMLLPKNTNFFATSGWLASVSVGRPVNSEMLPIPWLSYPAIDYLDTLVKRDWKVFEWGAGNSTLWWASKVQSVNSVEDNENWVKELQAKLPHNASVLYRQTQEDYVQAINSFEDGYFDVIVIDGSHRNCCAKESINKLSKSGIIIFDNSDGSQYSEGVIYLTQQGLYRLDFWGLIPAYLYKNCTSLFLKDPKVMQNLACPYEHRSSVGISCFQAMDENRKAMMDKS